MIHLYINILFYLLIIFNQLTIGWIHYGNKTTAYSNISILDISDKNNYKFLDTYVPPPDANNNVAVIFGLVVGVIIFAISLIAIFILYVKKSHKKNDTEFIIIDNEQIKLYKYKK